MDALSALAAVLLGALVGLATGLVPGLHVNTLAALAVALPPHPLVGLVLVATGTVHTIVGILPATYLGAPGEDTAFAVLPAHRLLQEGRAAEAIHLSVHASLLAALAAVLLVLPVKWLLGPPGDLLGALDRATPWLLAAVPLVLLAQEARRGARAVLVAALAAALAAALGLQASSWPVQGVVGGAATPLLPLLSGLFGIPALLLALHHPLPTPPQRPLVRPMERPVGGGTVRSSALGILAATWTSVLPGLTAAVATAVARPLGGARPRHVLATLSAVNTAHAVLALAGLWTIGRTRSGLGQALARWRPPTPWSHGPPDDLLWTLMAVLLAAATGAWATLRLQPVLGRWLTRVPSLRLHLGALVLVTAMIGLLTGPGGLMLAAAATLVGLVPPLMGCRRAHLAACLILPALVRHL